MCSHSQWMHVELGERARKLWRGEDVIRDRYHVFRAAVPER
jgi:hypothetical protein